MQNDKRCFWVMDRQQLEIFRNHTQAIYREQGATVGHDKFDDSKLSKSYLKNFVNFLRRRKHPQQAPFAFEKVIFAAIAFFKRYYLINSFMEQEPTQSFICAIYLAMKINEYAQQNIRKIATKWNDKEVFEPKRNHLHFGDDNYTEQELKFLNGFRFQTGLPKLIQPIESLYQFVDKSGLDKSKLIIQSIRNNLDKIYLDPDVMFLYEAPKLALALTLQTFVKHSVSLDILPPQLSKLIEHNRTEIYELVAVIESIEEYSLKKTFMEQVHDLRKLTKKPKFKKPEAKRTQSPRFPSRPHQSTGAMTLE